MKELFLFIAGMGAHALITAPNPAAVFFGTIVVGFCLAVAFGEKPGA